MIDKIADKIKTFHDNHKWFRVINYIFEFIVYFIYVWLFFLIFYNFYEVNKTIGEPDIYNSIHMVWFGCFFGLGYLFEGIVDYIERLCNRITNRNKIDN